jgi:hypothetical protein
MNGRFSKFVELFGLCNIVVDELLPLPDEAALLGLATG